MVSVRKRKKGKQEYFYIEHSTRLHDKVYKREKYIGKELPDDIEEIKQEFFSEIMRDRWHKTLDKIKANFSKEYRRMPKVAKEKYLEHFMIKFTYDSNRIEGSTLTLRDTRHLLIDGISPNNRPIKNVKEAESHKKLFCEMLECKRELSRALVFHWHHILLKDIDDKIAGKTREHRVGIAGSDVSLPLPVELETLLHEFFKWYSSNKTKLHPIELAALVHLRFVSIHPFTDGNGRISRMMMNFVLKKLGYPMLNIHYSNRVAYYIALERSQRTGNEHIFVQYIMKRYIKQYKEYLY